MVIIIKLKNQYSFPDSLTISHRRRVLHDAFLLFANSRITLRQVFLQIIQCYEACGVYSDKSLDREPKPIIIIVFINVIYLSKILSFPLFFIMILPLFSK